jgi:hypothetical protein
LLLLPCLEVGQGGVFGKPGGLFRRGLVEKIVGRDSPMILEGFGEVRPEARRLVGEGGIGPQPVVELAAVLLRPACAGQAERRDDDLEPGRLGGIEDLAQRHEVRPLQALVMVGISHQEVASFTLPLAEGQADPCRAGFRERFKIGFVWRCLIEAVSAFLLSIPEGDEIGRRGQGNDRTRQKKAETRCA